ncbi:MAG: 3,4-dihydroxy-2-butanone-4-phosphate synthase [Pseudooceanicola nanhaiensis]|uniref:3,4-dihydroxy-2-butanone-4-phosphate synthase n=1 Tax=Rhodobacterales TaxID=204455 RepID=UPI004058B876
MIEESTRLEAAIRAFAEGEMVIVKDDDGRENEGDLIVAACHCTAEKMAFIVRHSTGIVCAPMTAERARALHLAPMVADNNAPHATAFTVSVDFKHGTTTGISAEDRTLTVRNLANPNTNADDFVRPGHIFPLVSREGGVLIRSGHTEAATDLCRIAGLPEIGVICELVNDDGTVKRGGQLDDFAAEHGLHVITVADLIAMRQRTEILVKKLGEEPLIVAGSEAFAHVFEAFGDPAHHLAVVFGLPSDGPVPVRLQIENPVRDVFSGGILNDVIARMAWDKAGVIVYLREGSVGVRREGAEDHNEARKRREDWREVGLGAQIIKSLGVERIKLLESRSRRYVGLEGFGIDIAETELLTDYIGSAEHGGSGRRTE